MNIELSTSKSDKVDDPMQSSSVAIRLVFETLRVDRDLSGVKGLYIKTSKLQRDS